MQGTVTVVDGPSGGSGAGLGRVASRRTATSSTRARFELVAGRTTVIRFTNTDGTAHNVSIYRDRGRTRRGVHRPPLQRPGPGHLHLPRVPVRVRDHPARAVRRHPPLPPLGRRAARRTGRWCTAPSPACSVSSTPSARSWSASCPGGVFDQRRARRRVDPRRRAALPAGSTPAAGDRSTGGSTGRSSTPSARWRPSPSTCETRSTSTSWPTSSSPSCPTRCTPSRCRCGSATPRATPGRDSATSEAG